MVENTRCVFDRTASVGVYGWIRDSEHEPGWNSERRRAYLADYAEQQKKSAERAQARADKEAEKARKAQERAEKKANK